MKIYFAGPLFTEYERDYISKSAEILREHGIDPFVPHESTFSEDPNETRSRAKICLDKDFFGINSANAMLAIVNGAEVDDGTACEIGIFHSLMRTDQTKKGIVALHGDWRTRPDGEGKELNAFVKGCIEDVGVICTSLQDAIEQLKVWQQELVDEGHLQERK
jgi:nucleoside 2-deoxyribosyltransferase